MSQTSTPQAGNRPLVFRVTGRTDTSGSDLLLQVCFERGWVMYQEGTFHEDDWNIWWRNNSYSLSLYTHQRPWQFVNHIPRASSICRKHYLARHLSRMLKVYGSAYAFSPQTYNLPGDYTKWLQENTRLMDSGETVYWICKPVAASQGKGITVFQDMATLQYDTNSVVQRYISNPLLIAGYKFDLRIYVCVPSYHPLCVYVYQEGLTRFATEKYDMENLSNRFSHLTNTSLNKLGPAYHLKKERIGSGSKWTLRQLRAYFRQINVDDWLLWRRISSMITLTVLSHHHEVPSTRNCFELYGFDILIDSNLRPWLVEVNLSPSLTADVDIDIQVKKSLLDDLFDLAGFPRSQKNQLYPFTFFDTINRPNEVEEEHPKQRRLGRAEREVKSQRLDSHVRTKRSPVDSRRGRGTSSGAIGVAPINSLKARENSRVCTSTAMRCNASRSSEFSVGKDRCSDTYRAGGSSPSDSGLPGEDWSHLSSATSPLPGEGSSEPGLTFKEVPEEDSHSSCSSNSSAEDYLNNNAERDRSLLGGSVELKPGNLTDCLHLSTPAPQPESLQQHQISASATYLRSTECATSREHCHIDLKHTVHTNNCRKYALNQETNSTVKLEPKPMSELRRQPKLHNRERAVSPRSGRRKTTACSSSSDKRSANRLETQAIHPDNAEETEVESYCVPERVKVFLETIRTQQHSRYDTEDHRRPSSRLSSGFPSAGSSRVTQSTSPSSTARRSHGLSMDYLTCQTHYLTSISGTQRRERPAHMQPYSWRSFTDRWGNGRDWRLAPGTVGAWCCTFPFSAETRPQQRQPLSVKDAVKQVTESMRFARRLFQEESDSDVRSRRLLAHHSRQGQLWSPIV